MRVPGNLVSQQCTLVMIVEEKPEDGRSALWVDIAPTVLLAAGSLQNFRSASGVNSRLAHWAPFRAFTSLV